MDRISIKDMLLMVGALLAGWPGTAFGGPLQSTGILNTPNPLLTPALSQCVMLSRQSGRKFLVNRCNSCQIVKLRHKRPGATPAINRTYTVPARSKTSLPFRGPGQTRITSSKPCRPTTPQAVKSKPQEQKCAQFQRNITGGLIIINTCNSCQEIVTERIGAGNYRATQNFTIAGKSYVPMEAKGASKARILSEKRC